MSKKGHCKEWKCDFMVMKLLFIIVNIVHQLIKIN